jgi:ubiquinone/menaquinone biosynthesis C-methylase UbiE
MTAYPQGQRSLRMAKLAKIYDREILPIWSQRFARLMLRDLVVPDGAQLLDFPCATGCITAELLFRLRGDSRLIAVDESAALLNVARRKLDAQGGNDRVFFRSQAVQSRLPFDDGVYDFVLSNLWLGECEHPGTALRELARIARPGGELRCTLPLAGSFAEFYGWYRTALLELGRRDLLERLDDHLAGYATPERAIAWMRDIGVEEGRIIVESFSLRFGSAREFFSAAVVEYGPMGQWKRIAGEAGVGEHIFQRIGEIIEHSLSPSGFELTVIAGCLIGSVGVSPDEPPTLPIEELTMDDVLEMKTIEPNEG